MWSGARTPQPHLKADRRLSPSSCSRLPDHLKPNETTMNPESRQCTRCDTPGGALTFANQACLPIDGRIQCIDWCIHHLVAALNAGGIKTVASCCGHGKQQGRIDLKDGRILWIEIPQAAAAVAVAENRKCQRCDGSEYVLDIKSGDSDPCPVCALP